ncbi:hypothetical protein [Pedobacter sp. MC2016-24]|uniref:hypothetical protein n=1 Tax=Pedobacter sp. MC2016-24 TaxID=2780090 RepID=UPI001881BAC4|nr:hypothetical protein [Pedobacter sp. MC2016-24]MBE9598755.1 hypothetical protein [Pedobacter sp. MC2016-24]
MEKIENNTADYYRNYLKDLKNSSDRSLKFNFKFTNLDEGDFTINGNGLNEEYYGSFKLKYPNDFCYLNIEAINFSFQKFGKELHFCPFKEQIEYLESLKNIIEN